MKLIEGGGNAPLEPDWSGRVSDEDIEAARKHWAEIVAFGGDSLRIVHSHALTRLVTARVIYEQAARHVAEHGAVEGDEVSPWFTVMHEAGEDCRREWRGLFGGIEEDDD